MTTKQSVEQDAWWQLWLAPVFVLACCGSGLIVGLAGLGGIAAWILNPILILPVVLAVWLSASHIGRRRRVSVHETPEAQSQVRGPA